MEPIHTDHARDRVGQGHPLSTQNSFGKATGPVREKDISFEYGRHRVYSPRGIENDSVAFGSKPIETDAIQNLFCSLVVWGAINFHNRR